MDPLPIEPDLNSRLDELYDHESRMFIMLYSLHGDGKVDYVTGRLVQEYTRSNYGNPVYYTDQYPLFYWWNHTMFNDPDQDGVASCGVATMAGLTPEQEHAFHDALVAFTRDCDRRSRW